MTQGPVEWAAVAPPSEMQGARRWLLWSLESRTRPGGTVQAVKVPRYTTGEKRRGDLNNDAGRLVSYAEACAALALWGYAGLGFALGEGWQGVDFDKCDQRPELAALVHSLPGYVEVSPSRTGVHAIGYGAPFDVLGSNASGIEAYCVGRFFTFTGWCLKPGAPLVDLAPYVREVLAPRHAAHRKIGPVSVRPPVALTGDRELDELADALRYLDPDDRDTWINAGQALVGLGDAGRALWEAWAATSLRFPGGDDLERFDTFKGERTGYQSIFAKAQASGWKNPRKLDPAAIFAGSSLVAQPAALEGSVPAAMGPQEPAGVPPAPTTAPVTAQRLGGQIYREADGKQRAASLENVVDALGPASGILLAFDTFQDLLMIGTQPGQWRPLNDNDYTNLRMTLGRGGFKPVPLEIIRAAVAHVADLHQFDSAHDWVESLAWDGVPRIDTAMSTYYGAEDSPYSRAVGAYLFTALAGRALVHPLQADMAVILIGMQGVRKTSAIGALCPTPRAFGEVDLGKRDDDLARRLKGKMVVEWAEMRGLGGRDLDGIKAWITRRTEEWTPKYKEFATSFDRRCIVIGTANEDELLDDPTGERRWLPLTAGRTDVEGLERDRAQLWAEGAKRFRAGGIEWRAAETLARGVHADYKVNDEWDELVAAWLDSTPAPKLGEIPSPLKNGARPIALHEIGTQALGIRISDFSQREKLRIGKILRKFGFEKTKIRVGARTFSRWLPVVPTAFPA